MEGGSSGKEGGSSGMEGQPAAKPRAGGQLERQREPEEDGWRCWQGGQVGNTLHLVSAVAQWILLLACLVYLGVDLLRPSTSAKVPWTHIRHAGKSIRGAAVNLSDELGSIQIRNGSIIIPCDGLYLVALKSSIYLEEEEEDWLKLTLQATHEGTLWEQIVQSNDSTVNFSTVLYLFEQDSIALWTSSNASISDLSLSLVLVSDSKCQLEELE